MSIVRYTPAKKSKLEAKAKELGVASFTSIVEKKNEDGTVNLIVHMPASIGPQAAPDYVENVPADQIETPL